MDATFIKEVLVPQLLEFFFVLVGLQLYYTAYRVVRQKEHPAKM